MELNHDFRVSVPLEEAWAVMTDLERIAPCMPGAQLLEVVGDEYRGIVKVKVGPITVQYSGVARMLEKNDSEHRAVLKAEGRETRGQGNASATITATLREDQSGTAVSILTDSSITGKVAQFGRGLIADVSGKLLDQFVEQLEASVLSGGGTAGTTETVPAEVVPTEMSAASSSAASSGTSAIENPPPQETVRVISSDAPQPVDLLGTAGSSLAKRLVPAVVIVGGLAALIWWIVQR